MHEHIIAISASGAGQQFGVSASGLGRDSCTSPRFEVERWGVHIKMIKHLGDIPGISPCSIFCNMGIYIYDLIGLNMGI